MVNQLRLLHRFFAHQVCGVADEVAAASAGELARVSNRATLLLLLFFFFRFARARLASLIAQVLRAGLSGQRAGGLSSAGRSACMLARLAWGWCVPPCAIKSFLMMFAWTVPRRPPATIAAESPLKMGFFGDALGLAAAAACERGGVGA